jgi:hypothetical protein
LVNTTVALEDNSEEKLSDDETLPCYVSVCCQPQENPFLSCVQQIWPLIEKLISLYKNDDNIFEVLFLCDFGYQEI